MTEIGFPFSGIATRQACYVALDQFQFVAIPGTINRCKDVYIIINKIYVAQPDHLAWSRNLGLDRKRRKQFENDSGPHTRMPAFAMEPDTWPLGRLRRTRRNNNTLFFSA